MKQRKIISEFLQNIDFLQSKNYTCVYSTDYELEAYDFHILQSKHCSFETKNHLNVLHAYCAGISKDQIYYSVNEHSQLELAQVFNKCRLIATSLDALTLINQQVTHSLDNESFTSIAIRIIPTEKTFLSDSPGIYLNQLADLSAKLKKLDYIAIRGIFILPLLQIGFSAPMLIESFSIIKTIRSSLPCTFSYFCLEGMIDKQSTDAQNSILDTLEVIRLLNNTSLYADFLLG